MNATAKPFELTMKLRNNLLKARRVELGLTSKAMAESIGITHGLYSAFENLKRPPRSTRGWAPSAIKIAAHFGLQPKDLWPDVMLDVTSPVVVRELTAEQVRPLLGTQMQGVLHALPPPDHHDLEQKLDVADAMRFAGLNERERTVIEERFGLSGNGELTFDEVGQKMEDARPKFRVAHASVIADRGVSTEYLRQIELRALNKLREWFWLEERGRTRAPEKDDQDRAELIREMTSDTHDIFDTVWSRTEKQKLLRLLSVWYCASDIVIAKNEEQACRLCRLHKRVPRGEWKKLAYSDPLRLRREGRFATKLCAQWILDLGACWLCSVNMKEEP